MKGHDLDTGGKSCSGHTSECRSEQYRYRLHSMISLVTVNAILARSQDVQTSDQHRGNLEKHLADLQLDCC